VSFSVAQGEIVGLAGGGTSGKSELAETIVGMRTARSGTVTVGARSPAAGSVTAALRAGVGFVPQDRHIDGLVDEMSVADNATLTVPRRITKRGLLSRSARTAIAERAIDDLDIKTSGPDQSVDGLSGGNQQKVVMARAMASDPAAMVLIAPTAGVDVASKRTLMDAVIAAADTGRAALVVTDEIDDLRYCDRVLVMYHGRITGEFPRGFDDNRLIAAMEGLDS
jgi:simple sugar transport system ATP-binding protein